MAAPLTAGDMLGPYLLQRVLGEGSFGTVWLGEDMVTRQNAALKISPKDSTKRCADYARNEAKVMEAVAHPSNLAMLNFFETPHHCVLAMPFVEGGDMLIWLREQRRLPESTARRLFVKICEGVHHAHRSGYIHRDIKLENILISTDGDRPYLADWGFAGPWHADVLQNKPLGSLHYSAPEICRGSFYVGPEVDVWSLGVVLYALVTGRLPFRADKHRTTCEDILIANPRFPSDLTPECVSLLKRMLEPDRSLRITLDDVFTHPWAASGSFVRRTSAPSVLRGNSSDAVKRTASHSPLPSPKGSKGSIAVTVAATPTPIPAEAKRPLTPLPFPDTERVVTASPPPSPTHFLAKYLPFRIGKEKRTHTT